MHLAPRPRAVTEPEREDRAEHRLGGLDGDFGHVADASIAQRYRLELTVRGVPAPIANVTLRPGHDLPMRLLRRE